MEWLTNLLSIKRIPSRIIMLIWIVTTLLLYMPSNMVMKLNLVEFKEDYGKFFGIVFLVSTAFLIMLFLSWLYHIFYKQRLAIKYKRLIKDSVFELDPHEKAVLREYYIQGKNTLKIPMDNPTVAGLIKKRILYQVGQYGEMSVVGMLFNFAISQTARENLTLEILELPMGEPSQKDIRRITESRPKWMTRLESNQKLFDGF